MIDLSVVIPTYSRASVLDACLEHLAAQTIGRDRFEVIVADDASEDETPVVARQWEATGQLDLHYIRCAKGYAGAARNRGVASARGERIVFLGDDVLATPDCLARHLEGATRRGPDSVLVGEVRLSGEPWTPFMDFLVTTGVHHAFPQMRSLGDTQLRGWYFYACNASLPRAAFDQVGGFDESLHRAFEDGEFGFRLERGGWPIYFLAGSTGDHVHPMTVERYMDFLRAGRPDVVRVTRLALSAGEPPPTVGLHPFWDWVVSDAMITRMTTMVARLERALPKRIRWASYGRLLAFERRRAYLEAGLGQRGDPGVAL